MQFTAEIEASTEAHLAKTKRKSGTRFSLLKLDLGFTFSLMNRNV
jgi:hypothetical protein